ncbi:Gfo/Idh/MocA family oxidoreductase [Marinomonas agarivorans]|nr:Gfo/Idh/MocA family oxidoreductase [Marinomonas agarivorans]
MKWGVLGTSFISDVMANAIAEDEFSEVYSVAGRSLEPLKTFAEKYSVSRVFTDFDALIQDPEVDIIYIALPNHLHTDYIIKAAQAGKSILCEKSLSVDMETTVAALAAVEEHNVFFQEGLMYLAHPLAQAIYKKLQSGIIGDIHSIRGQYCAAISQFVNPASKGALYNLGCYPTSLMHLVLQTVFGNEIFHNYKVMASGRRSLDGNICETTGLFEFIHPQKKQIIQCHLHTAEDYGLYSGFTILGSKGYIELGSNPWLPETKNNLLRFAEYEQDVIEEKISAIGDGFAYQVRSVRESLTKGLTVSQLPMARPSDSHTIMRLLTDWEQAVPSL